MATLLEDQRRLGVRAQLPAPVSYPLGTAQPSAVSSATDVIGRRPPINMGPVDIVQPAALPNAAGTATTAVQPVAPAAVAPATPAAGGVSNPSFQGGASPEARAWQASRAAPVQAVEAAAPTLRAGMAAQPTRLAGAAYGVGRAASTLAPLARAATPLAALGGVAQSFGELGDGRRDQFQQEMGVETPLGSVASDSARVLSNVGDALTFGYGSRVGRGISSAVSGGSFSDGFNEGQTTPPPAAEAGNGVFDNTPRPAGVFSSAGGVPQPPVAAEPASNVPLGVTRSGNAFSGANVGSAPGAGPGPLGGTEDTNVRLARLQASNAAVPQGGLTVIDNPGPAAARAMFDEANLNTLRSRGAPPGRNGAQVFEQEIGAAQSPIQQRAAAAAQTARDAGETQRTLIQERAADARTRAQTGQQQEENAISRARLGIEAIRAGNTGVPAGYRVKTDGTGLESIPGGPADPNTPKGKNALNDTQAKALQFGSRMLESEGILTRLAAGGVNQPGIIKRGADAVGLGAAANWTQSPEQQQVEQAQRDFINATLRRESGAAIADSEFANARQQYFPQPGDSREVIAQKQRNRELATRGILAEVPDSERRLAQVSAPAAGAAPAAGLPAGMSRQVGTSGGKPVYEDAQGRRFVGG